MIADAMIRPATAAFPALLAAIAATAPALADGDDGERLRRDATVRAVEQVAPAVVNISTERVIVVRERLFGGSDLLEEIFGEMAPRRRVRQTSLGSGLIVDADGYVVTNAHVVARATTIEVTLPRPRAAGAGGAGGDGNGVEIMSYAATLVNLSPENDLAILKIDAGGPFPRARLGRSEDAMVGETVIALGNPFGLESSVTRGVLSATGRSLEEGPVPRFRDFLQTDAAINPGNSGGPLANLAGEVIGINTAVHSQAHGIGFAIPIARVMSVVAELLDERELAGTFTGLELEPGRNVVRLAAPESPAERAGLRAGDRIASVDGHPCETGFDVKRRVVEKRPGEKLKLEVVRAAGARATLELGVSAAPAPPGEGLARERLGLRVKPITPLLAERGGLEAASGVLVVRAEKGGPGSRIGLQAGDVIVALGAATEVRPGAPGAPRVRWTLSYIRSLDDLGQFLGTVEPGARILVQVVREGRELRGEIEAR